MLFWFPVEALSSITSQERERKRKRLREIHRKIEAERPSGSSPGEKRNDKGVEGKGVETFGGRGAVRGRREGAGGRYESCGSVGEAEEVKKGF